MASHNNNPLGYAWQTVVPAASVAGGLSIAPRVVLGIATNPLKTTLQSVRTLLPAGLVGYGVSKATNAASEAVTGKSLEENTSPYTGHTFSFITDPGIYIGAKEGYNFYKLGRYVFDELSPNSYSLEGLGSVFKAAGRALNPFKNPPKFGDGKKPKWYYKYGYGIGDREYRLQNSAIWAGIPESEIPRTLIYRRPDGTYGFTEGINKGLIPDISDAKEAYRNTKKYTVRAPDFVFGVGGLHSDFTLKGVKNFGNGNKGTLWLYEDEQKLNPQWQLATKLKKKLGIETEEGEPTGKGVKTGKVIDWFGGKDLKSIIGYDNDIKYKQYVFEDPNGKIWTPTNEQVEKAIKEGFFDKPY